MSLSSASWCSSPLSRYLKQPMATNKPCATRKGCVQKNCGKYSATPIAKGSPLAHYGIHFCYVHTLGQGWPEDLVVRPLQETKLPVVLSVKEVQRLLSCVRKPRYRVCLSTIYACGLRLNEGVSWQVADIDSARMLLHVRQGKGAMDRCIPLPSSTLEMLRREGAQYRHSLGPSDMALSDASDTTGTAGFWPHGVQDRRASRLDPNLVSS